MTRCRLGTKLGYYAYVDGDFLSKSRDNGGRDAGMRRQDAAATMYRPTSLEGKHGTGSEVTWVGGCSGSSLELEAKKGSGSELRSGSPRSLPVVIFCRRPDCSFGSCVCAVMGAGHTA